MGERNRNRQDVPPGKSPHPTDRHQPPRRDTSQAWASPMWKTQYILRARPHRLMTSAEREILNSPTAGQVEERVHCRAVPCARPLSIGSSFVRLIGSDRLLNLLQNGGFAPIEAVGNPATFDGQVEFDPGRRQGDARYGGRATWRPAFPRRLRPVPVQAGRHGATGKQGRSSRGCRRTRRCRRSGPSGKRFLRMYLRGTTDWAGLLLTFSDRL